MFFYAISYAAIAVGHAVFTSFAKTAISFAERWLPIEALLNNQVKQLPRNEVILVPDLASLRPN